MYYLFKVEMMNVKRIDDEFIFEINGITGLNKFYYYCTFDKKAKKIKEELKTNETNLVTLREIREEIKAIKESKITPWDIMLATRLDDVKKEDLVFVKEEYDPFSSSQDFGIHFKIKGNKKKYFTVLFSTLAKPLILCTSKTVHSRIIHWILLEETKDMIFEEMLSHSKEKVRLLTNGYNLNYKTR